MAEFFYYGSKQDGVKVLQAVLSVEGMRIIPDRRYSTTTPKSHNKVTDELLNGIPKGVVFIAGSFTERPISFLDLGDGTEHGRYIVNDRTGGPLLSLRLPLCKKLDGHNWHLGPGDVFYQRQLWDEATKSYRSQSAALKMAYANIVKRVKLTCHRRTIGGHRMWMGDGAWELLTRDDAYILWSGKWLNRDGEVIKSNLRNA